MLCEDFCERFMSTLKAPSRVQATYTGNVAVLVSQVLIIKSLATVL